jgi:hypothetical protein
MEKKQLFFSHTWKSDNLDRDNHARVKNLANCMKKYGWTVWLDEDEMMGNIDACMVNGIKNSECIIACLTTKYIEKINHASNNTTIRDNCFKEWTYSNSINKSIIPVIMEEDVITCEGKGILDMYLGNMLFLDLSSEINNTAAGKLNDMLLKLNYKPKYTNTLMRDKIIILTNRLKFNLLNNNSSLPPIKRRESLGNREPHYPNMHKNNLIRERRFKSTPNFLNY